MHSSWSSVDQTLDIQRHVTAKIAFDALMVDRFTKLGDIILSEILDAGIGVDAGFLQNVVRELTADAVDISETDLNALFTRQVYAGYTCHLILHLH